MKQKSNKNNKKETTGQDNKQTNNKQQTRKKTNKPPDIDKLTPTVLPVKVKSTVVTDIKAFLAKKRTERDRLNARTDRITGNPTTTDNSVKNYPREKNDDFPGEKTFSKPNSGNK